MGAQNRDSSTRTSPKWGPVTAIRPEIGSLGNRGRLARFLKKSGFLNKIWTNQHVGRGANFGANRLTVPRFGRPKRGFCRPGPDVAEIGALLPRFGLKWGRPEMMVGCPDFFLEIRQISKSAAAPISSANHLVSDSFWLPEMELRPALPRPYVAKIGPLLRRFAPRAGCSEVVASRPDLFVWALPGASEPPRIKY